jgi:hypothetical protein
VTSGIEFKDYRQPEQFEWIPRSGDALTEAVDVVSKAKVLFQALDSERTRLFNIDKWWKGIQDPPEIRNPEQEGQKLLELSRTPWMSLIVSTVSQTLYVEDFQNRNGKSVEAVWDTWLANRMPSRQSPLYRCAEAYGYSFLQVRAGNPRAVMQGFSPKRVYAQYRDPAFDAWPVYALRVDRLDEPGEALVWLYDDTFEHSLKLSAGKWSLLSTSQHGAGCVPFIRYAPSLDLDGYAPGQVEPLIGVAARIDKTEFDRMLTQHYNSWKKIWVAGLQKQEFMSEEDQQRARMVLRQQDMMIFADNDTRIGALEETSLDGFLKAIDQDVEKLATLGQVPAYLFSGSKLASLDADTIVAANKPFTDKIYEHQVAFTQSHNQALRLVAYIEGNLDAAEDLRSTAKWRDIDLRSLAQAADALAKSVDSLGVPKTAAWRLLPGVTESQAQEWENLLISGNPYEEFLAGRYVSGSGRVVPTQTFENGLISEVGDGSSGEGTEAADTDA